MQASKEVRANMDASDPEVAKVAKSAYMEKVLAWRRGLHRAASAAPQPKKRPAFRVRSWELGMEVEHGLLQAHGANFRLTRYFLPAEVSQRNSDPLSWPRLGVTMDCGPDNTCLIHTMLYKWHANVDLYLDDSHGFKNDMKGVYKQSGGWHWIRCMMPGFGFNVWLSPWWEAM